MIDFFRILLSKVAGTVPTTLSDYLNLTFEELDYLQNMVCNRYSLIKFLLHQILFPRNCTNLEGAVPSMFAKTHSVYSNPSFICNGKTIHSGHFH